MRAQTAKQAHQGNQGAQVGQGAKVAAQVGVVDGDTGGANLRRPRPFGAHGADLTARALQVKQVAQQKEANGKVHGGDVNQANGAHGAIIHHEGNRRKVTEVLPLPGHEPAARLW